MERQTVDSQHSRLVYSQDMERQNATSQNSRLTYGQDDTFDIEVGMGVFGADGKKIGTVVAVAGFGSTHVHETSHPEAAKSVTQARSGTGHVTVDRREVQGRRDAAPLYVPFHGIEMVSAEQGVVLNGTVITEMHDQEERIDLASAAVQPTQRVGWYRRILGRNNVSTADTRVAQRETDDLREEVETRERHGDSGIALDTADLRGVTPYMVSGGGLTHPHEPEFSLGESVEEESAFDEEMRP